MYPCDPMHDRYHVSLAASFTGSKFLDDPGCDVKEAAIVSMEDSATDEHTNQLLLNHLS